MGSSRPSLDFLLEMTEPESRSGSPAGIGIDGGDSGGPEDEDEDDDLTTVDEEEPTLAGEEQQSVASSTTTTTAAQPSKKVRENFRKIASDLGRGEPSLNLDLIRGGPCCDRFRLRGMKTVNGKKLPLSC